MSEFLGAAVLTAFGTLEGMAFHKVGMHVPSVITEQMQMRRFIVLKLFLAGVGVSALVQGLFSIVAPARFEATREYRKKQAGYARIVTGCLLLGIGMAIAGSGPSIVPTQLVTLSSGLTLLAGSFVGGLLYALVEASCPVTPPKRAAHEIDTALGVSYPTVALPMGALMLGGALALEVLIPNAVDAAGLPAGAPVVWSPVFAGAIIGFNQIPLRLIAGHGQGASRSIQSVISMLSGGRLSSKTKFVSIASIYQLLYIFGGTALGAYYSLSTTPGATIVDGYPFIRSFVGAMLMQFGSRYAQGCTCGHGISGVAELSFESLAGAASIFGGGILAALFL